MSSNNKGHEMVKEIMKITNVNCHKKNKIRMCIYE